MNDNLCIHKLLVVNILCEFRFTSTKSKWEQFVIGGACTFKFWVEKLSCSFLQLVRRKTLSHLSQMPSSDFVNCQALTLMI